MILCSLLFAAALAAPDKNLGARGPRARQIVNGNGNGRAIRNGAVVRKAVRKGRGRGFALNPALAVPAPLPLNFRAAPAVHHHAVHHHAPALIRTQAPFQVIQPIQPAFGPAPAPLQFTRTPLPLAPAQIQFSRAPLPLAPAPVQFSRAPLPLAPAPLPLPAAPVVLQRLVPAPTPAPAPVQPTLEYGAPATVAPEVRVNSENYGAPSEPEVIAVRDSYLAAEAPRDSYLAAEPSEPEVIAVRTDYGSPVEEETVIAARDNYGSPAVEEEEVIVAARDNYGSPAEIVEVRAPPALASYNTGRTANVKSNIVRAKPIAIVRSSYNPPAETSVFDYSFESENGIKQEATGSMRIVDDVEVSVMKGSYSYIGADSVTYTVDWYADETGFHATAPHLPKSVVPNHPEVAAAVRAQLVFAAEEDAVAAASGRSTSYLAPEEPLKSYAPLASYN